jgi:hypothetical protein
LCVPKTCATWADASAGSRRLGSVSGTLLAGAGLSGLCNDLRLVGLKLHFDGELTTTITYTDGRTLSGRVRGSPKRVMASVRRATSRCSAAVSGWRAGLRLLVPLPPVLPVLLESARWLSTAARARLRALFYAFLGGAEHLGDFGGVVAQDVAEDERGALAWGQQLQGGDQGQGDGLGGLVPGLRSGPLVDEVVEQDVRAGLQPGRGVAGADRFGQGDLGQGDLGQGDLGQGGLGQRGALRGRRLSAHSLLRHRLVAIW